MTTIDKYMPSQGGLGGMWNQGTSSLGNVFKTLGDAPGKLMDWGNVLIYGGVIVVGGVLLMIAYSFASGKQSLGDVAAIAKAVK